MIIASGFVVANEDGDVEKIIKLLKARGAEVGDVSGDKIVYLIERETTDLIEREIESLKEIDGIRNVYLTYFSLEGSDEITT